MCIFSYRWGDEDPYSYDIIQDPCNAANFCIDLKNEMPFPVFQRFIELLPRDSLRRFTYTSKENYVNGLKYRGVPCFELIMFRNEFCVWSIVTRSSGKVIVFIEDEFFPDPIFKFFTFDELTVQNNNVGINIPKTYSTLKFFRDVTERLEEHLHPGVKNLKINAIDVSTRKTFNKIFGIIKRSNVINLLLETSSDKAPTKSEVTEYMGWIKQANMNVFIAREFLVNLGTTYKRRYIYWFNGDFYLQNIICNDIEEYADVFCNEIPIMNNN